MSSSEHYARTGMSSEGDNKYRGMGGGAYEETWKDLGILKLEKRKNEEKFDNTLQIPE